MSQEPEYPNFLPTNLKMDELTSARSEDCMYVPHIGVLHEFYSRLLVIMRLMREKDCPALSQRYFYREWVRVYEQYKQLEGRYTWCDFSSVLDGK